VFSVTNGLWAKRDLEQHRQVIRLIDGMGRVLSGRFMGGKAD
jgi:hypothetical protein